MFSIAVRVECGRGFEDEEGRNLLCHLSLLGNGASSLVLDRGKDNGQDPVWEQAYLPLSVPYGAKSLGSLVHIDIKDSNKWMTGAIAAETEFDFIELKHKGMWVALQGKWQGKYQAPPEVYVTFAKQVDPFAQARIQTKIRENQRQRVVKVFLSSTFKDMRKEREVIMHKVMVKLNAFCYERSVSLMWVDMQWGITEEMTKNGNTLVACLREIDNSRPYFVGFLGHRYGWHQEHDGSDPALVKTFERAEIYPEYLYFWRETIPKFS